MAIALVLKTSAGNRLGVRIPHPPLSMAVRWDVQGVDRPGDGLG